MSVDVLLVHLAGLLCSIVVFHLKKKYKTQSYVVGSIVLRRNFSIQIRVRSVHCSCRDLNPSQLKKYLE